MNSFIVVRLRHGNSDQKEMKNLEIAYFGGSLGINSGCHHPKDNCSKKMNLRF
ncbi:MAG: hypothetical protein ACOYIF_07370 [Acetivibrionales bacterium]